MNDTSNCTYGPTAHFKDTNWLRWSQQTTWRLHIGTHQAKITCSKNFKNISFPARHYYSYISPHLLNNQKEEKLIKSLSLILTRYQLHFWESRILTSQVPISCNNKPQKSMAHPATQIQHTPFQLKLHPSYKISTGINEKYFSESWILPHWSKQPPSEDYRNIYVNHTSS